MSPHHNILIVRNFVFILCVYYTYFNLLNILSAIIISALLEIQRDDKEYKTKNQKKYLYIHGYYFLTQNVDSYENHKSMQSNNKCSTNALYPGALHCVKEPT